MQHRTIRKMAVFVSVGWIVAALALWTSAAVPASAYHPFDSQLHASAPKTPASSNAVLPDVKPLAKRATPVPESRREPAGDRTGNRIVRVASSSVRSAGGSEIGQARALLASEIAKHPILRGTTVAFGDTHGYQAISYYRTGEIVLSRSHTASLSRIISHEVWHIIDWRDNGRIDWGENVPR